MDASRSPILHSLSVPTKSSIIYITHLQSESRINFFSGLLLTDPTVLHYSLAVISGGDPAHSPIYVMRTRSKRAAVSCPAYKVQFMKFILKPIRTINPFGFYNALWNERNCCALVALFTRHSLPIFCIIPPSCSFPHFAMMDGCKIAPFDKF